jgi:hypothetical protein
MIETMTEKECAQVIGILSQNWPAPEMTPMMIRINVQALMASGLTFDEARSACKEFLLVVREFRPTVAEITAHVKAKRRRAVLETQRAARAAEPQSVGTDEAIAGLRAVRQAWQNTFGEEKVCETIVSQP